MNATFSMILIVLNDASPKLLAAVDELELFNDEWKVYVDKR